MSYKQTQKETDLTWIDLVRKYFPDATVEQADFLLWEKTCFPVGSVQAVEEHLREAALQSRQ
jgi:hypothetical protein